VFTIESPSLEHHVITFGFSRVVGVFNTFFFLIEPQKMAAKEANLEWSRSKMKHSSPYKRPNGIQNLLSSNEYLQNLLSRNQVIKLTLPFKHSHRHQIWARKTAQFMKKFSELSRLEFF
jgi:hypothetical protein